MPAPTVGRRVERAHLAFALAIQRTLPETGAACWSPYSVASALGLAATGARGTTLAELTALLAGDDASIADHGALLTEASSLDGGKSLLAVANTLWHEPALPIRQEFLTELAGWPSPALHEAPFATDPEAARRLINTDVAHTTRGLIAELLSRGSIGAATVAMLVNALYLKVDWVNTFPKHDTAPMLFHGQATADVPTMRLEVRMGYAAESGWQVLALPASGGVDAVILLPDGDITSAESTLDTEALGDLLRAPSQRTVRLYLPRFRVKASTDLNGALRKLGVHTMFDHNDADFGGISPQHLYVDRVAHQAVLKVDEDGIEGAAATAVAVRAMAMRKALEPLVVHVDRPFLFLVRHRTSGAIYFLSRVVKP